MPDNLIETEIFNNPFRFLNAPAVRDRKTIIGRQNLRYFNAMYLSLELSPLFCKSLSHVVKSKDLISTLFYYLDISRIISLAPGEWLKEDIDWKIGRHADRKEFKSLQNKRENARKYVMKARTWIFRATVFIVSFYILRFYDQCFSLFQDNGV